MYVHNNFIYCLKIRVLGVEKILVSGFCCAPLLLTGLGYLRLKVVCFWVFAGLYSGDGI